MTPRKEPLPTTRNETPGGVVDVVPNYVELVVEPDEDGGWIGYVPSLPGVGGQGETEVEAFVDVEKGLRAAIEAYRARGRDVPFLSREQTPPIEEKRHRSKWIEVK